VSLHQADTKQNGDDQKEQWNFHAPSLCHQNKFRAVTFVMALRTYCTIAANVCLFVMLWKSRQRYRGLFRIQAWAIVSTAVMLSAQLIPHTDVGDQLYNALWTSCDLADAAAECFAAIILWRMTDWDGEEMLKPVLVILMGAHLYLKLTEYWAHDPFHVADWMPFYLMRQWENLAVLCGLIWMVEQERRNRVQGEPHARTRREAEASA
jgi:hypothetical protein